MLTELKFVQGAVAKKDFIPALSHFQIKDGFVQGFNGILALCSPIPFDIACNPKADALVKAIGNCGETVQLSLTAAGKLSIRSGKFRANIECITGDTPHVQPDGETIELDGEKVLAAVKALAPFIGNDASRPWTNGLLLKGESAYATNNVIVVEYWMGGIGISKPVNIPRAAIKEMLRLDEPPTSLQMTDTSVTFHYAGERWLRTQLFPSDWPDLARILDKPSNPVPWDPELGEGLRVVKPFIDKFGRVMFTGTGIATHAEEGEGARYDVDGFGWDGVYHIEMISLLPGTATSIDWSLYPSPCLFFGENLRGAIVGMHK